MATPSGVGYSGDMSGLFDPGSDAIMPQLLSRRDS
jgi:hypothetical protein